HCLQIVKPALANAEQTSRQFARSWSRLALSTTTIATVWDSPAMREARKRLGELVKDSDGKHQDVQQTAHNAVAELDPEYRAFFYQALMLFALNFRLSSVLGRLVIRHRRQTEHRLTLVGEEYVHPDKARARQDRHILHAASGLDVRGEEELPHYLLMRC